MACSPEFLISRLLLLLLIDELTTGKEKSSPFESFISVCSPQVWHNEEASVTLDPLTMAEAYLIVDIGATNAWFGRRGARCLRKHLKL